MEKQPIQEGIRLGEFRKEKGLSQKQMAQLLECSQPNLSKIEKGDLGISTSLRESLIKAFPDINPNWLFTGAGNSKQVSYDMKDLPLSQDSSYKDILKRAEELEELISKGRVPLTAITTIMESLREIISIQGGIIRRLEEDKEFLKTIIANSKDSPFSK